jgi:hypothetical protein
LQAPHPPPRPRCAGCARSPASAAASRPSRLPGTPVRRKSPPLNALGACVRAGHVCHWRRWSAPSYRGFREEPVLQLPRPRCSRQHHTLMKGCTAEVMAAYASACRPACISARHCACAATTSFHGSCSRWHACAGAHRAFCCLACTQ